MEYVESHCLPQVNYTLKANVEKLTDVGDLIKVKDERLGVDLLTNVIGFEYDCILEQYTEIEFGNFSNSLSGFAIDITQSINTTAQKQEQGIVGTKQLLFNSDGTVTWTGAE